MTGRVCAEPGCPNLRPCLNHQPTPWARTSARNTTSSSSNGWARQRLRQRILRRDRHRCCVPGCSTPATEVDHVIPVAEGGTDEPANLAAICAPHHAAKSQAERTRGRRR